jgi:hypothetical protein
MVTVKTKNPHYDGYIKGVRFVNGVAEVSVELAEKLVEFDVSFDKPEKEEKPEKPKKTPRKKQGE